LEKQAGRGELGDWKGINAVVYFLMCGVPEGNRGCFNRMIF